MLLLSTPNSEYNLSPIFEPPKPLKLYKDTEDTFSYASFDSESEDNKIFSKETPTIGNPFTPEISITQTNLIEEEKNGKVSDRYILLVDRREYCSNYFD